jgi:hypothetical protein
MKYKFKKIDFSYGTMPKDKITYDYGVDYDSLDEEHKALFQIAWHGWTPSEVQMIIDKSNALAGDEKFKYQVVGTDLMIYIFTDKVFFCDLHNDTEEPDFKWTFDEFITFMKDFKRFIEDNQ